MNRRALLIALLLATCGTSLLLLYLRRFEREMSGGDRVQLVTLVKAVERGTVITEDMLATRAVPMAYVEDRAVKAGERNKVVGLPTATALSPQQTLMWTDLAITTEERDLSSLVQPGKRGVTVRATGLNDTRGNALIRPGDYVDVIVTAVHPGESREESASVLLQRVLVLAVGQETGVGPAGTEPRSNPYGQSDKLLTLSLSLADAQLLALALEKGRLSVAVRNVTDPAVQTDIPDVSSSALLGGKGRVLFPRQAPPSNANGPVAIGGPKR